MGKDNPGTYSRVLFLGLPGNTDTWGMVSREVWRQKSPRHQHGSLLSLYIFDSNRSPDWIRISDDNPNYIGHWFSKYCYSMSYIFNIDNNLDDFIFISFKSKDIWLINVVLHPNIYIFSNLLVSYQTLILNQVQLLPRSINKRRVHICPTVILLSNWLLIGLRKTNWICKSVKKALVELV